MKIGILGAGQLGRMLAEAGRARNLEFKFLDPAAEISAAGLGDHICAAYDDADALQMFSKDVDVITYEFENVPLGPVRWLAERIPVYPPPEALRTAQDRLYEKTHAKNLGIPVAEFHSFFFQDELVEAITHIGFPAVMKTRRFGYDGKGQRVINDKQEAEAAFVELQGMPLFLEEFVPFDRELSILATRDRQGRIAVYNLVENHHREGILRLSRAPARGTEEALQSLAEDFVCRMLESLHYVGTIAIEFFEKNGTLYFNEMAPRVHNSGHWTIEGAIPSQFDNHLRAITGNPLETPKMTGHAAMINLIGGMGDANKLSGTANAFVHDYGKTPRPGRKVGHVTLVEENSGALVSRLKEIAALLKDEHLGNITNKLSNI